MAQIGGQGVVHSSRSAEATSVLLAAMITIGGLAVVVASGLIDADGRSRPTSGSLSAALTSTLVLLIVCGLRIAAARRRPAGAGQPQGLSPS